MLDMVCVFSEGSVQVIRVLSQLDVEGFVSICRVLLLQPWRGGG